MGDRGEKFEDVLLSIIIVNYKVCDLLLQTIRSVISADGFCSCEIIVVDNNSKDGSKEIIESEFGFVKYIELPQNLGFGKACNIGAQKATGKYLLMLNPDTIISKNTLEFGINYLENNKNVGVLGPKILNQDGSFQYQCRRSFPTPLNAFAYMSGLSRIFKKSKTFGKYNLSFLPIDEECSPDAVSGACFFIAKEIYEQIDGFDESFFMYGEDLDLCAKVKELGLDVRYSPKTEIIHFKGRSSVQTKLKSRLNFYAAMVLFSKKYKKTYGTFFPNWLLAIGIWLMAGLNISVIALKKLPLVLTDLFFANVFIPVAAYFHSIAFNNEFVYFNNLPHVFISHFVLSVVFLGSLLFTKHYSSPKPLIAITQKTMLVASLLVFAVYYAVPQIAYSRIIVFSAVILSGLSLVAWRKLISPFSRFYQKHFSGHGNAVLLAQEPYLSIISQKLEPEVNTKVLGVLDIEKLPLVKTLFPSTNSLIIGSKANWYPTIIKLLSEKKLNGVSIYWLSPEDDAKIIRSF